MRDEHHRMDSSDRRTGDRGTGRVGPWAVLICKLTNKHDWQPHAGMTKINFRVCRRCGETGWEV